MAQGIVKNIPEFRNAVKMALLENKWTLDDFARSTRENLLPDSKFTGGAIRLWITEDERQRSKTIPGTKFIAAYPFLKPFLERTNFKIEGQVGDLVRQYEEGIQAHLKQGDLFDDGQTVESHKDLMSERGYSFVAVQVKCGVCGAPLDSRRNNEEIGILAVAPCQQCVRKSAEKRFDEMVASFKAVSF